MNPYAYSVLAFGFCSFLIGLLVWARLENRIGFSYFLFSGGSGLWGMTSGLVYSGSLDDEVAITVSRIAHMFAIFIGPLWYKFTIHFSKRNEILSARISQMVLFLAGFFLLCFCFSDLFISEMVSFQEFRHSPKAGMLYHLFTSLFFISVPMGFMELLRHLKNLSGKEKSQGWSLIVATGAGFLGGSLTFAVSYQIPLPQYGIFAMPLYPLFMGISMMRIGLLTEENLILAAHKDKLAALGILTASINHEIRSPLFVMRGTIESGLNKDSESKLLNQIDRITGIVSRLTHFAKKGVEEAAQIEAIDLKEVLADIRPLFQHQLNYQQIEYNQDIPPNLPKLMADRRYLEEILFNLILNACQALKETPNPSISLRGQIPMRDREWGLTPMVAIEIADNGPGIAPEQLKTIFKPFHTTKQEGTGLGLYITKQLIEKCGGKIEVESQPGSGAKFIVSFKAVDR